MSKYNYNYYRFQFYCKCIVNDKRVKMNCTVNIVLQIIFQEEIQKKLN